jgi:endoglucanase
MHQAWPRRLAASVCAVAVLGTVGAVVATDRLGRTVPASAAAPLGGDPTDTPWSATRGATTSAAGFPALTPPASTAPGSSTPRSPGSERAARSQPATQTPATTLAAGRPAPAGVTSTPVTSTPATLPPVTPRSTVPANPLAALPFTVDSVNPAALVATQYPSVASKIGVIARTPQAVWLTEYFPTSTAAARVRSYLAQSGGKSLPTLVLYAIPNRDCGSFSSGGFSSAGAYLAWVNQVVAGIGANRVAVIVEPDALAMFDCLSAADQQARLSTLKSALTALRKAPGATVYLDGGHSRWLSAATLADRLTRAGVVGTRGFSLNVSGFFYTSEQVAYGEKVVALLAQKGFSAHYVVDTSRNGTGPLTTGSLAWCNPRGRALGQAPTTATGAAHADAYLWVKNPGVSDGHCNRGDPASGAWFQGYAEMLVANRPR